MKPRAHGLHHVTAIAGNAQRNLDFYTRTLGLRLVKKTVNFDDPHTYHFYFGNADGAPGTIMTFFPWERIQSGQRGAGQVTETAFAVPLDSLGYWTERLDAAGVIYNKPARRFEEEYLTVLDPDGLKLELVTRADDDRAPHVSDEVDADRAIRGFDAVTLTLRDYGPTAEILTEVFGYHPSQQHVNRYRYETDAIPQANVVDLVHLPTEHFGRVAGIGAPRGLPCAHGGGANGPARADRGPGAEHHRTDRPAVLQVALLPGAGRRVVRNRHRPAGLHRRRGGRRTGHEPAVAAAVRIAPGGDRTSAAEADVAAR